MFLAISSVHIPELGELRRTQAIVSFPYANDLVEPDPGGILSTISSKPINP
jgi:hypothetical protein